MITSISQVVIGVGGADSSLSGSSSLNTISLSIPFCMIFSLKLKIKILSNFFVFLSSECHNLFKLVIYHKQNSAGSNPGQRDQL